MDDSISPGGGVSRRKTIRNLTLCGAIIGGVVNTQPAAAQCRRGWYLPNSYNDGGSEEFAELDLTFNLHNRRTISENIPCDAMPDQEREYTVYSLSAIQPDDWVGPGPYLGGDLYLQGNGGNRFRQDRECEFIERIEICEIDTDRVHHGFSEIVTFRPA